MTNKSNALAVSGLVAIGAIVSYVGYKAYQKGRVVGHTEGYQQATHKYENEIENLKSTLSQTRNTLQNTQKLYEQQVQQTVIRDAEIFKLKEEIKRLSEE